MATWTLVPHLKTEPRAFCTPVSPDLQEGTWGPCSPSWGEVWEEQACSLGGLHILLHVYAHSVTHGGVMVLSVLCWMVPGCGIWGSNSPVPGLADLTASPASPNRPFLYFSVADSTEEAKSTNRQQCFAEGKRVREVKVNNIPCSLQWARDCWTTFSVSLKRKGKSREGTIEICNFQGRYFILNP